MDVFHCTFNAILSIAFILSGSRIIENKFLSINPLWGGALGHCKVLYYGGSATKSKGKNIKLAMVNCVDGANLCQENEIRD